MHRRRPGSGFRTNGLPAGFFALAVVVTSPSTPTSALAPPEAGHGAGHMHHDARAAEPGAGRDHHAPGTRGPLGHRFPDAKSWAKTFDDPARDAWQKPAEVIRALEITPGMVIADVGAGTGYLEPHLVEAVGPSGRVLGLDVEPGMVRHLRARAKRAKWKQVEAVLVPFDDPKLAPASVDRIVILDTWHHIPDRTAYGQKLRAALRPGGRIFVVDFTLDSPRGPPRDHRIDAPIVVGELASAGLDAHIAEESLPDQYIVVASLPPATPPQAKAAPAGVTAPPAAGAHPAGPKRPSEAKDQARPHGH